MEVKIVPNEKGNPPGKLADAELHFDDELAARLDALAAGDERLGRYIFEPYVEALRALAGLKLIGFAIWERKTGNGRNVTFPARQYNINGERRSFALLRPIVDTAAQDRIRDLILAAYAEFEEAAAAVQS